MPKLFKHSKLIFIIPILLLLIACSIKTKKHTSNSNTIQTKSVEKIEIIRVADLYDTTHYNWKKLNQSQVDLFIKNWNTAKSAGICKYAVAFFIVMHLKDKNFREFRANGNTIKEKTDQCFQINKQHFFEDLYANASELKK